MVRPREFEEEVVLREVIRVFAEHGFEATSTEDLVSATGLSRQSMYNAFGDKKKLYLTALQRYNEDSIADLLKNIGAGSSPIESLKGALYAYATRRGGCMGVNAICEFGISDKAVTMLTEVAGKRFLAVFKSVIVKAKAAGEIRRDVDVETAAHFMLSTASGMKVSARAGGSAEMLRKIARLAIHSLA
jgi:AcrR family transcriptional regulator